MAHSFLENIDDVDVISDAEVILNFLFNVKVSKYKNIDVRHVRSVYLFFFVFNIFRTSRNCSKCLSGNLRFS
jgi:hypothetical protein